MKTLLAILAFILISSPIFAQTIFTVTTNDDTDTGTCSASHCSFREAINAANALNDASAAEIRFDINSASTTIVLGSLLPSITQPGLLIDGLTQAGASCGDLITGVPHDLKVEIDGSAAFLGFNLEGDDQMLKGLVIGDFPGDGIQIRGDRGLAECNYVGTQRDGTTASPNLAGIRVLGNNVIISNNLISGNTQEGIYFVSDSEDGNVSANLVGVTEDGLSALGNQRGIRVQVGSENNKIGGPTTSDLNVISGNTEEGVFVDAEDTVIEGNYIGVNRSGTSEIGNKSGVRVRTSRGSVLANVVSGNELYGVLIHPEDAIAPNDVVIQGNKIGSNVTGSFALPNSVGVGLFGTVNTLIGGPNPVEGNLISGNGNGIEISTENNILTQRTKIYGNIIGLNSDGTAALANAVNGIKVSTEFLGGVILTLIGQTSLEYGNIISGNGDSGILIDGQFPVGTVIQSNYLGTDLSGTVAIPNEGTAGINFETGNGAILEYNLISGNSGHGIRIKNGFDVEVLTNLIGTDVSGVLPLGNQGDGIWNERNNYIGSDQAQHSNTIAFNQGAGITNLDGLDGREFSILGNSIYANGGLGIDNTANDTPNFNDLQDLDDGSQNFPTIDQLVNNGGPTSDLAIEFNSTPDTEFRIEIFSVLSPDPTGFGEGNVFRHGFNVITDGSGNYVGTFPVTSAFFPAGSYVSATATRITAFGSPKGTSEFSPAVEVSGSGAGISLNPIAFLQGSYTGTGLMRDNLLAQELIPNIQPYSGSPWFYSGGENLPSIPQNVVDWVLVELRSVLSGQAVSQRAGLLMTNGKITDLDGISSLSFPNIAAQNYYVVIRHRLHLDIISSIPVDFSSGFASFDFSTSSTQAYGTSPMVDLGDGRWGLWAGDGNADNTVSSFDFLQEWLPQNGSAGGYYSGDFNMSGDVSAFDFINGWLEGNGRSSQVPN